MVKAEARQATMVFQLHMSIIFTDLCFFMGLGYWACNLWHIQVLIGDSANQHRRIIQFPGRVEVEAIWKDDSLGFAVVWILKAQVFLWTPCECYLFVLCDFQPKCSFFYFNLEHFEFKQGERGKLKEIRKNGERRVKKLLESSLSIICSSTLTLFSCIYCRSQ